MKKILIISLFTLIGLGSFAQSYVLDTTFTPFFDIRTQRSASVNEVVEMQSGKLFLGGGFTINFPNKRFDDVIAINQDGSFVLNLNDDVGGGVIIPFSNSKFAMGNQFYGVVDTNGNADVSWFANYRPIVACSRGRPFFYPNGASLFANSRDNSGKACKIVQGTDTFPGRHIIKLTPQGLWDSTFNHDATYGEPEGFVRYDSNRIFIYGDPLRFTHYDSIPINGMCRIYLDGTLDTTFSSPINPNILWFSYRPLPADNLGRFFVVGNLYLKGNNFRTPLVRFLANGDIDPTFHYTTGAIDLVNNYGSTSSIVKTPDGGYLIGGFFDEYQGVAKKSIVKVDSNGILEPQYFTSLGPDSADQFSFAQFQGIVSSIIPSKFGGYYVAGNFLKWDGQASQPIVKITGLNGGIPVGLGENGLRAEPRSEVLIYPNPTTGIFRVESELGIESVAVYDIFGALVQLKRSSSLFLGTSVHSKRSSSLTLNNDKYRDALFEHSVTENKYQNERSSSSTTQGGDYRDAFLLNLINHANGIYFLKIELENGEVMTKKILKQ